MIRLLEVFYILSLIGFAIIFIAKSIIYAILDKRNGHPLKYGRVWGYENFLPYDKEVSQKDERLKMRCNKLHKLSIVLLIVFCIVYIVRFIIRQ